MRKLTKLQDNALGAGEQRWLFFCPGYKEGHCIITPRWKFDGNVENPTISPSILTGFPPEMSEHRCHSFIRNGQIQFLDDCHHELKGQTVDLPDLDVVLKTYDVNEA